MLRRSLVAGTAKCLIPLVLGDNAARMLGTDGTGHRPKRISARKQAEPDRLLASNMADRAAFRLRHYDCIGFDMVSNRFSPRLAFCSAFFM